MLLAHLWLLPWAGAGVLAAVGRRAGGRAARSRAVVQAPALARARRRSWSMCRRKGKESEGKEMNARKGEKEVASSCVK